MKTIAIDLDDTLNNFTETLQKTPFPHDPTDGMSEETFQHFLKKTIYTCHTPSLFLSHGSKN